jgi:cytochrome c oxidase assembly factor CtaG/cytochrome c2
LGLLALAAFYGLAVHNLWEAAGPGRGVTLRRVGWFYLGWAVLAVALISPIDALGSALFAGHMTQHVLIMMAAAPLLALGAPAHIWLWLLPLAWRRELAQGWRRQPPLRSAAHTFGSPLAIWLASTLALWLWHLPQLYEAALVNDFVHGVEHLSFLLTAWLFWGVVVRPLGHGSRGAGVAVLLLFTAAMQSGVLGALITLAPSPWYTSYAATTAAWGLSPLADQQLAGVIMWVPAGTVYLAATLLILGIWLVRLERAPPGGGARQGEAHANDGRRVSMPPALVALLLVGAGLLAAGCSRSEASELAVGDWTGSALPGVRFVPGGNAQAGAESLAAYGCGSCHVIPGVVGADSAVGPPLNRWAERHYIAGSLINTPDNLITWIRDPQSIEPGTAMPNLGVTAEDARHMSAYLYTLER